MPKTPSTLAVKECESDPTTSGRLSQPPCSQASDRSATTNPALPAWQILLRKLGWHALACVGMFPGTGEVGTWPNEFGHATRGSDFRDKN